MTGKSCHRRQRGFVGPLQIIQNDHHRARDRGLLDLVLEFLQQPESLVGRFAELPQRPGVNQRLIVLRQRRQNRGKGNCTSRG
jgi:hypothetical protein